MSGQMDCKFFRDNLDAFIDSELDQTVRERMIEHARACPECAELLDGATRLVTMCAELDEALTIPPEAGAAWRSAVRVEAKRRVRSRVSAWTRSIGAAAAVLALMVGGTAYYRSATTGTSGAGVQWATTQNAQVADEYDSYDVAQPRRIGYAPSPNESAATGRGGLGLEADGSVDMMVVPDEEKNTGAENAGVKPVVIRSAERRIESAAFDADLRNIQDLIAEYECVVESSSAQGQPIEPGQTNGRKLYMSVRVPVDSLDAFLSSLDAVGTATYKGENAVDVSDQYYDVRARLDSAYALKQRLDELVADAQEVADVIAIEEKMSEVMSRIDSLEGQIRAWDSRASYSGVDVSLAEVAPRDKVQPIGDSLGERVKTGFFDSVNWLVRFAQDMAVVFAIALPQLVIAVPVIVLVIVIIRIILRKRRAK